MDGLPGYNIASLEFWAPQTQAGIHRRAYPSVSKLAYPSINHFIPTSSKFT